MKYYKKVLEYILCFLLVFSFTAVIWSNSYYGHTTGDEKFFHLFVPLNGISSENYYGCFLYAVLPALILGGLLFLIRRKKLSKKIYFVLVPISIIFALYDLDLFPYIKNNINSSKFIENNYVAIDEDKITFNEKKNLIYIYLESMENTYSSREHGGSQKDNLIPNLTKLAEENTSFSNTDKLGGALYMEAYNFTVASMMSQTTGLPLKINYSKKGLLNLNKFYLGTALGDILYDNGYNNYIIMGSNSLYGQRKALFEKHHYNVSDVESAIKEGKMSRDDIVWWGYSDKDLFKYAKEDLSKISKNNKPFNYTMLTVDTHFQDGYLDDDCKPKFDDQYSSVIYCNDAMIKEFLDWLAEQDFYDNTVVILVGDHITMDQKFSKKIDKDYIRTTYNVFLNVEDSGNTKNRQFTQLDMFPTTIHAIGGKIEGDRLALGTNLFSGKKTLVEKYGYKYVRGELNKRSEFYNGFLAHR